MTSESVILVRTETGTYDACWADGTCPCHQHLGPDEATAKATWDAEYDRYPITNTCNYEHHDAGNHYQPCSRTDRPCPIPRR